jgi:cytochrome c oxidase subunit 2
MSLTTIACAVLGLTMFTVAGLNQAAAPRKISIEAERFSFSPSRIKVTAGEEVEIHLRSADTSHGFKIEGTDINVEIPKRGKGAIVVRFKPETPGRLKFECTRMCGSGHHFMQGEVVVEAKE